MDFKGLLTGAWAKVEPKIESKVKAQKNENHRFSLTNNPPDGAILPRPVGYY